nr:hypothetical protein CFP56_25155 [Quercus suber]
MLRHQRVSATGVSVKPSHTGVCRGGNILMLKGLDLNYVRRVHMLAAGFTVVDTMTYRNLNSETFLHDAVLMDLIVQYDKLEYQVFLEKKEVKKEI